MAAVEPPRRRYNVGAVKIPYELRDVAHAVITDDDDRGYRNILGAEDTDPRFQEGATVAYTVELTDAEAAAFEAASNCRYVEEDGLCRPHRYVGRPTGPAPTPSLANLAWMRARYDNLRQWHGRDVKVAVLDNGTTKATRDAMGLTLVARTITSGITLPAGQETFKPEYTHGCFVASAAVPPGGLLLDAIVADETSAAPFSAQAAAITWAVDQGASVINISFGGDPAPPGQVMQDAFAYARDAGVQITISAGNEKLADLDTPSSGSRLFSNVHSIIAFDPATDRRGLFSNYAADASGCSAGVYVDGINELGQPELWNGTSAAAPYAAHLMARAMTGGRFTPAQVGAAFKVNTRNTGTGAQQGGGAYDLHRALYQLGAVDLYGPVLPGGGVDPVDTRGVASLAAGYTLSTVPAAQPDDMRIAVLVSSYSAGLVVPPGWELLTDAHYNGAWENDAGQSVGPTRVRVLGRACGASEKPTSVSFGGGDWYSAVGTITLRGAGGLDPEQFVPIVRFGTSGSVTAPVILPSSTSDHLVYAFAQRHPSANTGTLSTPAGLTQRGFWRPTASGLGYTLLLASANSADNGFKPEYVSTSNDSTGTWCAVALSVPPTPPEIAAVVQSEPAGPPGAFLPFLPMG